VVSNRGVRASVTRARTAFDTPRAARYLRAVMPDEVAIYAPAKVNLHLDVRGRRPDGYHDIVSVFVAVSLADVIVARRAGAAGSLALEGEFGFPAEQNLVSRAVRLFRDRTGMEDGLEILVEKRIPMAAGLGGGSSEAAATLRCLEALHAGPVAADLIAAMALELGSDVPFFLGGAAALAEGRGERLRPLRPRQDFTIVAAFPGAGVQTAEAYRLLDEHRRGEVPAGLSAEEIASAFDGKPPAEWPFTNSFDPVVFRGHPAAASARDALAAAGAHGVRLTGSGSTVIGTFADPSLARTAAARLMAGGRTVALLKPLAAIPAVCYNSGMRIRQWEDTHGDYGHSHQEGRI
jgi:4-diphosphocytidyl-2-C-methyl-D-erythritol kinase